MPFLLGTGQCATASASMTYCDILQARFRPSLVSPVEFPAQRSCGEPSEANLADSKLAYDADTNLTAPELVHDPC